MTKATGTIEYVQTEEILNNEEFGETMLKMAIGLNELANNSYWRLGDIRQSIISESDFQNRAGDNWVLLNGQDITGSDLDTIHGVSSLPDIITGGRFFAQNNGVTNVFDLLASLNGAHDHRVISNAQHTGATQSGRLFLSRDVSSSSSYSHLLHMRSGSDQPIWTYRSSYNGDASKQEGYPTTLRVNFFIKINDTPTNL